MWTVPRWRVNDGAVLSLRGQSFLQADPSCVRSSFVASPRPSSFQGCLCGGSPEGVSQGQVKDSGYNARQRQPGQVSGRPPQVSPPEARGG